VFDPQMITIHPILKIIDFTFDKTHPETKRSIMGAVFHLIDNDAMYRYFFFSFSSFFPL